MNITQAAVHIMNTEELLHGDASLMILTRIHLRWPARQLLQRKGSRRSIAGK
jgi:hypothetical protein